MKYQELRKSILAISQIGLLGALPIFATAKILNPHLEPKGKLKYAAAALSHDDWIIKRLMDFGNPFDKSKLDSDREYQDLVNSVVSALRDMSFEDFLRSAFPDLAPNPKYLSRTLNNCKFKEETYEVYAVMQAILEWTGKENDPIYAPFQAARSTGKNNVSSKMDWEDFRYRVNCHRLAHKQKVSTYAHTAAETLRKYKLSFRTRAALFSWLYCKLKSPLTADEAAPPLVIGDTSVSSSTVQKALNAIEPDIGKLQKVTDGLKEFWTNKPDADDSGIFVGFYLHRMLVDAQCFDSALVINPSPDFLEKASKFVEMFSRMTFAVPLVEAIPALKLQFPNTEFLSFKELEDTAKSSTPRYDYAWLLIQEIQSEDAESLMEHTHSLLKDNGLFYAELPSNMVTYRDATKKSILHESFSLRKIYTFEEGVFQASPQKRVLTLSVKENPSNLDISISRYTVEKRAGSSFLVEDRTMQTQLSPDVLMTAKAISKVLENAVAPPNQHRRAAEKVKFLPDVTLLTTLVKVKGEDNAYRVRGYVASILTETQSKRNRRSYGKSLTNHMVTSPVLQKTRIENWCQTELPYKAKIQKGVKEAIEIAKPSCLSLRTLWYIQTTFSKKWFNRAGNQWTLALFSSEVGLLTGKEPKETFVACVNVYLDRCAATFADRLKSWRIIHEVCASGVKSGVMEENPASETYKTLYNQASYEEYAELRGNLAKKDFTLDEEGQLIRFLHQKVTANPEYLAVFIRLFTGLPPGIVAGLTWQDINETTASKIPHFLVRREIDRGRNVKKFELLQQFRQFPISPILKKDLDARREAILSSGKISPHDLAKMPIIATDAQIANGSNPYTRLRTIKRLSKETLASLNLEDVVVLLPNKSGGKEPQSLTKYQGDIFLSNFKSRVRSSCGFLEREVNYLCGLRQKGTYDRHYCDYTNPFIQAAMYAKLSRGDVALQHTPGSLTKVSRSLNKKAISFIISGTQIAEIEFPANSTALIRVESQHGLDLVATMKEVA